MEVVVVNYVLVMVAMESEVVLFDLKNLLLVLDEGYYLLDVVWDVFEMSVEIIVSWYRL